MIGRVFIFDLDLNVRSKLAIVCGECMWMTGVSAAYYGGVALVLGKTLRPILIHQVIVLRHRLGFVLGLLVAEIFHEGRAVIHSGPIAAVLSNCFHLHALLLPNDEVEVFIVEVLFDVSLEAHLFLVLNQSTHAQPALL